MTAGERRKAAPWGLSLTSVAVAVVFAGPLLYLVSRVVVGDVAMRTVIADDDA